MTKCLGKADLFPIFCQQKAATSNPLPKGVPTLRCSEGEILLRWTVCKTGNTAFPRGNQNGAPQRPMGDLII